MLTRRLITLLWFATCAQFAPMLAAQDLTPPSPEQAISAAPAAVRTSAQQAVANVQLQNVETVWEHDSKVYKFTGTRFMAEYRIFVRSDAKLLRVEKNNLDDE